MQKCGPLSWVGRTLVAGALFTLAPSLPAQEVRQQRVLALYVTSPGAPGAVAYESTLLKVLGPALGSRLDFHGEYIDLARFSETGYADALVQFLGYSTTSSHLTSSSQPPKAPVVLPSATGESCSRRHRLSLSTGSDPRRVSRIRPA